MRKANAELPDPLPDGEIVNSVAMAWRYRLEGRLMVSAMTKAAWSFP